MKKVIAFLLVMAMSLTTIGCGAKDTTTKSTTESAGTSTESKAEAGSEAEALSGKITMLPTLIIFIALQKHIYNGLTNGAVKG